LKKEGQINTAGKLTSRQAIKLVSWLAC